MLALVNNFIFLDLLFNKRLFVFISIYMDLHKAIIILLILEIFFLCINLRRILLCFDMFIFIGLFCLED